MPTLNMRAAETVARYDLAFSMADRGFPIPEIMVQLGYKDESSVYRAIKSGRERAESNEFRVSQRSFGIEIEFNGTSRSHVVETILSKDRRFPVETQSYNHQVQRVWKMITDSSVNGTGVYDDEDEDDYSEGEGLELVSPILSGQEGFDQLALVVEAIHEAGGDIDSSCGLHVHHDARDLTPHQVAGLLRFYIENQEVIDRFLAPVRRSSRHNQWCQPWSTSEKAQVLSAAKSNQNLGYYDRYRTLNVTSYPKYGSLEFRQHQGTLNFEKMLRWVKFGQSMVEASMHFDNPDVVPNFSEPAEMLDFLVKKGGLPKSIAEKLQAASDKYDADIARNAARRAARAAR